jgi:hypothetical protein
MVKKNQRVILLYPESTYIRNFTFLWDKEDYIEGSYANKDKLDEMVEWNVGEINLFGGHGKIFELSWTLTTQDSGILFFSIFFSFISFSFSFSFSFIARNIQNVQNFFLGEF